MPGDVDPGNVWFVGEEFGVDCLDGFADFDEPDSDGVEDQSVGEIAATQMVGDRVGGGQDIGESLAVVAAHNVTASARTAWAMLGLSVAAGTTSTSTLSRSDSCRRRPASPTRLTPSSRSTRRSMSLVSVSWPLATLPNTRTLCAPRCSARSSTA